MFNILKKFFAFCSAEDRKRFYISIALSLFQAMFEALKIPAIACMVKALTEQNVRTCPHRVNVWIFRHNFVSDKAKSADGLSPFKDF